MSEELNKELVRAATVGDANLIKKLISQGANVEAFDDKAVITAMQFHCFDAFFALLDAGANPGKLSSMAFQCFFGITKDAMKLLKPNYPETLIQDVIEHHAKFKRLGITDAMNNAPVWLRPHYIPLLGKGI